MTRKVTPPSSPPRSREKGHSKEKHLDPLDNEMSGGLESDDVPKSFLTKEEIQRVVREELEPVKSYLKEVDKELKDVNSRLADLFRSPILDTVKGKKVQPICSSVKDDDTIQAEVREESEHPSSPFVQPVRSSGKRRKRDEGRNWQLQFEKEPLSFIYTEQKQTINVKLVDANTGNIVKSDLESSVEVEVVALKGDSKIGSRDNWNWEEFDKSIEEPREGKPPLLNRRLVNLNGGTGVLDNVRFTDNSSWTRSKTFRLGLRAPPEYREIIREEISGPIRVKEKRGQSNKKHDELAPGDEVWRIKTIGRNGPFHRNLSKEGICNVGQFFQLLNTEPDRMKIILGTTMTQTKWDELRGLAKTFLLNGNPHLSFDNEDDHQNGRQLTDHTPDRVHCAADEFPLKQENHEDIIGKASSSFPYQVSERQTKNLAPAQDNMASSTCTAPVGPEAPPANAGSIAEGLNELAPLASHQPIPANNWNGQISSRDKSITTGGLPTQPHNLQFAMPNQMNSMANEHVLPPRPTCGSISSSRNVLSPGHNELASLASHQPIPANNWNGRISSGDNSIAAGGLPTQAHNLQFAMPSQMNSIANEHVLPPRPTYGSISSSRNGHNELAPLALHQSIPANNWNGRISSRDNSITASGLPTQAHNLQFAIPSQMDSIANEHALPSRPTCGSTSSNQNVLSPGHNELAPHASHQPISINNWNGQISLGDNSITAGGLPTQAHNIQFAMPSQMNSIANEHVLPLRPTCGSTSSSRNVLSPGHNELAPLASHQPIPTHNWNGRISSGDNSITAGGLPTQAHNLQFAMPSQMNSITNEHVLPPRPTYGSISCSRNVLSPEHNEIAPLASHQPIPINNWNSRISSGDNSITASGLPTQPHNLQFPMPSQMNFIANEHVLPPGPTYGSIPGSRNGQPTSADRLNGQFPPGENGNISFGFPTEFSDEIDCWAQLESTVNEPDPISEALYAPRREEDHVMTDLPSSVPDNTKNYLNLPIVDTSFRTPWDGSNV